MSEFNRVDTLADLFVLDSDDMHYGYIAGLNGAPEPVSNLYSRGYWHGWRNGVVDGCYAEQDEYQERLAWAYSKPQWVH